ncbi:MAG: hypothetical protein AAFX06_31335 [Planctomycetota bacterium]
MPISPIRSERPGGSFEPGPSDGWIMPLGTLGGIRFSLSYSVIVALAVLAGVVAMVQHRPGDQDLPLIALIAVSIWSIGWMVQVIVQLWLHLGTPARSESITIGLVGVELGNPLYRRNPWSTNWILVSSFMTFVALTTFGFGCLTIHMHSHALPDAVPSPSEVDTAVASLAAPKNATDPGSLKSWLQQLSKKSFGLDEVHNCYLAAAWLLCFQATCQAFPLPRHLGRGALAAMVAMVSRDASDSLRVSYFRNALFLIVGVTIALAVVTVVTDSSMFPPRWPILLVLAFVLWASTRSPDLEDWVASIRVASSDPARSWLETSDFGENEDDDESALEEDPQPSRTTRRSWLTEMVDSVRLYQRRRRARTVWQREQAEARDEAEFDRLLSQIASEGTESLNEEQRAVLERVSERKRRDRQSNASSEPSGDGDPPE